MAFREKLDRLFNGALQYVTQPPFEAIKPFRSRPAPLVALSRKAAFFSACIFAGLFYGFWGSVLPPGFIIFLIIPFLLLTSILLWVWPDDEAVQGQSLAVALFSFTAVSFLWPNYLAIGIPGLPWLSLRRIVGLWTVAIFLMSLASSKKMRSDLVAHVDSIPIIWKMLIAFFLTQTISIFFSPSPVLAYKQWFNTQYAWTAIFFISCFIFSRPGNFIKWSNIILACSVIVSLIAIAEQFNKMVLWANHIPPFLQIDSDAVERILRPTYRGSQYRSQAIFGVSLALAEFLALSFTILLHKFMTAKSMGRQFWLGVAMIASLVAIGMSRARLGFIGVVVALALYGFIWGYRQYKDSKTNIVGAAMTYGYPAIMMVAAVLLVSVDALRIRILGGGQAQASNDGRQMQFDMAPPVIMQSPIFGHGGAQGGVALGFRNAAGELTIDSYLLSVILDYGIVGFVLFYGSLACAAFFALRWALRSDVSVVDPAEREEIDYIFPIGVMLAQFYVIKTVLSQEENHTILFMMFGALLALFARYKKSLAAHGLPEKL